MSEPICSRTLIERSLCLTCCSRLCLSTFNFLQFREKVYISQLRCNRGRLMFTRNTIILASCLAPAHCRCHRYTSSNTANSDVPVQFSYKTVIYARLHTKSDLSRNQHITEPLDAQRHRGPGASEARFGPYNGSVLLASLSRRLSAKSTHLLRGHNQCPRKG